MYNKKSDHLQKEGQTKLVSMLYHLEKEGQTKLVSAEDDHFVIEIGVKVR